jgi:tripartite-type tricarboxylate transporter receptor subunit TctC
MCFRLSSFATRIVSAIALAISSVAGAMAQDYPNRQIQLIVPFAPGGGTDQVGRFFAQKLSELWGKPVVVDNRGGAGGNIGTQAGARATPDGYTLTLATNAVAINHTLYANIAFDVTKDFGPISMLVSAPMAIVVNPSVPANSVQELIALAKRKPGALNYGSPGIGTPQHLAAELFQSMTDTSMTHVPYRGAGPALQNLLAGDIQVMFPTLTTVESHVKAGSIRALGVTDLNRSPVYPKLPTIAESGVPSYQANLWYAMMAPDKTPAAVVRKINTDLRSILEKPETKEKLESLGFQPAPGSPAELQKTIVSDIATWAGIIKRLGLKATD